MKAFTPDVEHLETKTRKKHRLLLTIGAVAIGVGLVLLVVSLWLFKMSWSNREEMRAAMASFHRDLTRSRLVQPVSSLGLHMGPPKKRTMHGTEDPEADLLRAMQHLHLNMTQLRGLVGRARNRSDHRDVLLTYLLSKQKELRNTVQGFLCAPPYVRIHPAVCIRVHMDSNNWAGARGQCKKEGGDLMTLKAASQTEALTRYLHAHEAEWLWIGLYGHAQFKSFQWSSDGSQPVYTNWQPREPGHSGNCVNLNSRDGRWDNDLCGARLPFICQKHFFEL